MGDPMDSIYMSVNMLELMALRHARIRSKTHPLIRNGISVFKSLARHLLSVVSIGTLEPSNTRTICTPKEVNESALKDSMEGSR
jgi:hypothetical protein